MGNIFIGCQVINKVTGEVRIYTGGWSQYDQRKSFLAEPSVHELLKNETKKTPELQKLLKDHTIEIDDTELERDWERVYEKIEKVELKVRPPRIKRNIEIKIDKVSFDFDSLLEAIRDVLDTDLISSFSPAQIFCLKSIGVINSIGSLKWLTGPEQGINFYEFKEALENIEKRIDFADDYMFDVNNKISEVKLPDTREFTDQFKLKS